MRKFHALLLLVSSILLSHRRLFVAGGKDDKSPVKHETLAELLATEKNLSNNNQETLAYMIEQERIMEENEQNNALAKHETLADLFAMEQKREKNSAPEMSGIWAELLEIEQIREEEFDQFVAEWRENEQIVGAVFKPKSVGSIQELKGLIGKTFSIRKSGEKEMKSNDQIELEQKFNHFSCVKNNDPALSQVIEKVHMNSKKILSGNVMERPLKIYLKFVVKFLAKRQQIPENKLVPEKMNKIRALAFIIKICMDKKREKEQKSGQKSSNSKEKRLLRLLLTVVKDEDGTNADEKEENGTNVNLALEFNSKKQKKREGKRRRKKREFLVTIVCCVLALAISLIVLNWRNIGICCGSCCCGQTQQQQNGEGHGTTTQNAQLRFVSHRKPMSQFLNNTTAEEMDKECSICLGKIEAKEDILPIPCQHIYHAECLSIWFQGHNTCPICRAEFDLENVQNNGIEYANNAEIYVQSPILQPMNLLPRN